ncbi:MAG TPA: pyruvate kinase [Saprospiraceae bacterium]|nr:pyruvate kinase [Saprospiraceae bacterium]
MRRADHQSTKIIATIGPVSSDYSQLLELAKAGVNVFRLNFSHGTHDEHRQVIQHILYINEKYNFHLGILCDLQGPKLRVGDLRDDALELKKGDMVRFVQEPCEGTLEGIYVSYPNLGLDVKPGERVLLDDGSIVLRVKEIEVNGNVLLTVVFGGILYSRKGVNFPDTKITMPSMTEKDIADLDFMLTQPINWIALSFVRSPQDINNLRVLIEAKKHNAKIIAKIEKPEAVQEIKKIIKCSNGIMVARGDLGVEMPMEKLPSIQKKIIRLCIQRARPVIVATQMLNNMIENPAPTRAEVTDVANAVLDGADAVMLSGETSVGKYPIESVKVMHKIISEAESHYEMQTKRPKPAPKSGTFYSDIVCFNACKTAEEIGAKAIIGMTISGYTAFKLSSYRPRPVIYIFSAEPNMLSTLNLVWGVQCFYYDKFTSTDETIHDVIEILKMAGHLKKGDVVVNTGSMPMEKRLMTNMLKVTIVE